MQADAQRTETPGLGSRLATTGLVAGLGATAALRVWLTASLPTIYRQFPVDDLYYVRAAEHILDGRWLGPYNQNTLVKGVGYPLFLMSTHTLGLTRRLAEDLLLVAAAFVLAWALRRVARRPARHLRCRRSLPPRSEHAIR